MKSPLNISETARRYGFDEDMTLKQQLIDFDSFIWQDCHITTVDELITFEKEYQECGKDLQFCYDADVNESAPVYMFNGEMPLLCKGTFQKLASGKGELHEMFIEAGLTELESVIVRSFLADISGLYRKDAYPFGIPPFVQSVCERLNSGLSKLPAYMGTVVRACNEYDKADFKDGDLFTPNFCLTCSADLAWQNKSENRYKVQPLDVEHTKARNLFQIRNTSEQQVTFLQEAHFLITGVSDWGEGKKQFEMQEILVEE